MLFNRRNTVNIFQFCQRFSIIFSKIVLGVTEDKKVTIPIV